MRTYWSQRILLIAICVSGLLAVEARATDPDIPPAATLQTGDFLWPKVPNKIVPYNSRAGIATQTDQVQWESERRIELKRLAILKHPTPEEKQRYHDLKALTYDAFLSQYLTGVPQGGVLPYGAIGPIATGHVAIVEIRSGVPWIIEAMLHKGVQAMSYADWLKGRPGEKVWHGRLKDATPEVQSRLVSVAKGEMGKPYDFWNFDLSSESGFYCSKLAWFSVWKAVGESLDGNGNPRRVIWYSPKQMQHSSLLSMISSPGRY